MPQVYPPAPPGPSRAHRLATLYLVANADPNQIHEVTVEIHPERWACFTTSSWRCPSGGCSRLKE